MIPSAETVEYASSRFRSVWCRARIPPRTIVIAPAPPTTQSQSSVPAKIGLMRASR